MAILSLKPRLGVASVVLPTVGSSARTQVPPGIYVFTATTLSPTPAPVTSLTASWFNVIDGPQAGGTGADSFFVYQHNLGVTPMECKSGQLLVNHGQLPLPVLGLLVNVIPYQLPDPLVQDAINRNS